LAAVQENLAKSSTDALNARVNLVTSQRDLVVGSCAILAASGRLSLETLEPDTPTDDFQPHFEQVKDNWSGTSTTDDR